MQASRAPEAPPATTPPATPARGKQGAAPASIATPPRQRVATGKPTIIRAQPDTLAASARVVPAKVILIVFQRKDDWLEVGSTYAWGWVHSSFVYRYDPHR